MKRVMKFQTADGRLFDTAGKAKEHEAKTTAIIQLGNILKETMRTGRSEAILGQIIEESTGVVNILTSYRKRLPRKKEAITGLALLE